MSVSFVLAGLCFFAFERSGWSDEFRALSKRPGCVRSLLAWIIPERFRPRSLTAGRGKPIDAFVALQEKDYFLVQNAKYLDEGLCGGTCASVSSVNNMLVMAETMLPGSVSRLSRSGVEALHVQLMREVLNELKALKGVDGRNGASFSDFKEVYPNVFGRVFHIPLAADVSVHELDGVAFQSVKPGENSLLILGVQARNGPHAVVVTAIKRLPVERTPENNFPEEFIVTISDPHAPGKFKDLKVYESGGSFYLEGYGKKQVSVEAYNQPFKVNAGLILDGLVINFRNHEPTRNWSRKDVTEFMSPGELGFKANLLLKDGTTYEDVFILQPYSDTGISFYHQFMLSRTVPLEAIADIRPK